MWDARIKDVELLINPLTPISRLIYEGIFVVKPDRLEFCWNDATNALVVNLKIDKSIFKEWNMDKNEDSFAVNINDFINYLKRLKGTVRLTTSKARLTMKGYEPEKEFEIPQIDLKEREIPDYSKLDKELEKGTVVEVDYDTFTTAIEDAGLIAESFLITLLKDGIGVKSDDVKKYKFELHTGDEKLKTFKFGETGQARFSYDYLKRIFSGKVGDVIKLKLKNNYPMTIELKSEGVNLFWLLAPRSEGSEPTFESDMENEEVKETERVEEEQEEV